MLFLIPLFASFILSYLLIRYKTIHISLSGDHDIKSVQKFHHKVVPRIGGIAILVGLLLGFLIINTKQTNALIITFLPVFIAGLAEDLTKKIPPNVRLLAAFISAGMAIFAMGITLTNIDINWFDDNILSFSWAAIAITIFMIGGVSHATNIIDGFNGLLLGYVIMALLTFLWVAFKVSDADVFNIILVTLGAILGLFAFNFPKSKIFTGDSGAYLSGFILAIIALLLVKNNQTVSPWMPLLVLIYPVFETLFSIYKKKVLKGTSPAIADGTHLHMLIYKRVIKHRFLLISKLFGNNAATAIFVWFFVLPFMLPVFFFWDNSLAMFATIIAFCLSYLWLYFAIIRFKL